MNTNFTQKGRDNKHKSIKRLKPASSEKQSSTLIFPG